MTIRVPLGIGLQRNDVRARVRQNSIRKTIDNKTHKELYYSKHKENIFKQLRS